MILGGETLAAAEAAMLARLIRDGGTEDDVAAAAALERAAADRLPVVALTPSLARAVARALLARPTVLPALRRSALGHLGAAYDRGDAPLRYRVDGDDTIVEVDEVWRAFAELNGAPGLSAEVIGASLWDAVSGREPQILWRMLAGRVRGGESIELTYRCDAPQTRRTLRMRCDPMPAGGIEFTSRVDVATPRAPVELQRGGSFLVEACSWCNRVKADAYVEIEEAVERLRLLAHDGFAITHTICTDCSRTLRPG